MFKKANVSGVVADLQNLAEKLTKIFQDETSHLSDLQEEAQIASNERDRAGRIIGKLNEILK